MGDEMAISLSLKKKGEERRKRDPSPRQKFCVFTLP